MKLPQVSPPKAEKPAGSFIWIHPVLLLESVSPLLASRN